MEHENPKPVGTTVFFVNLLVVKISEPGLGGKLRKATRFETRLRVSTKTGSESRSNLPESSSRERPHGENCCPAIHEWNIPNIAGFYFNVEISNLHSTVGFCFNVEMSSNLQTSAGSYINAEIQQNTIFCKQQLPPAMREWRIQ